jgi:uncharacterized damage-inducible protein DinB
MTSVLLELVRHKTWATVQLIEYCQRLAPEHLDATVPGTFGSVRDTLRHLLRSDEGYFRNITGEDSAIMPPQAGLGALAERFRERSKRWEAIMQDPALPDRDVPTRWGTCKAVAAMAQSIHHADDHRTQVLSILGARGLRVPELDMWAYGAQAGYVHESEPAPTA